MTSKENQKQTEKQKSTEEFSERRAHFFAILEVLKAKKRFVLLTMSFAIVGTILGHIFQETFYTASASLFVQPLEEPTAAEYLLNQQVGRTTKAERIDTYMRYLSSDAFFLEVAQKLKYHPDVNSLVFTSPDSRSLWSLAFWKNKLVALVLQDPTLSQQKKGKKHKSIEELVDSLKHITSFETDFSHFIHIKCKTLEPRTAQIIANISAEEFVSVTNQRGIQEVDQIKTFVEGKIEETQLRLKATEMELIDFKKKNSLISTDANSTLIADRYTKIGSQLESARLQFEENQKMIEFFEKGQKAALDAPTPESNTQPYSVKETALILQRKLEQLKKQRGLIIAQEDKNQEWRLKEIDDEYKKTLGAFKDYSQKMGAQNIFLFMNPQKVIQKINELKEENEALKNKIATHNQAMDQVKGQIQGIPYLTQKQLVLENNLRLDNDNYTHLKNKLMELDIQRISQKKEVRVDQVAQTPGPSLKGNLLLKIIFSSLVAALLGISVIIGLEAIDPTVKHRSDLNDCGLEFIGEIPLVDYLADNRVNRTIAAQSRIVCLHSPESIESMAFKYIRARLESYKYKFKKDHIVISISSSGVGEGKSFVSANLAVSLSQLKRKTLIMDCDFRRPSQNGYFDTNTQIGVVDLLDMNSTLEEALIRDVVPGLDYLPSGICTENSTEIISSEKFRVLVGHLRKQYEYVIIDTPPIFAAVDSSIIASYSDVPILLANFRETKKYALNEAYNQLLQVSYKRVYGLINKAIVSTKRFHYYGYHNYSVNDKPNYGPTSGNTKNSTDIQSFLDNLNSKSNQL